MGENDFRSIYCEIMVGFRSNFERNSYIFLADHFETLPAVLGQ